MSNPTITSLVIATPAGSSSLLERPSSSSLSSWTGRQDDDSVSVLSFDCGVSDDDSDGASFTDAPNHYDYDSDAASTVISLDDFVDSVNGHNQKPKRKFTTTPVFTSVPTGSSRQHIHTTIRTQRLSNLLNASSDRRREQSMLAKHDSTKMLPSSSLPTTFSKDAQVHTMIRAKRLNDALRATACYQSNDNDGVSTPATSISVDSMSTMDTFDANYDDDSSIGSMSCISSYRLCSDVAKTKTPSDNTMSRSQHSEARTAATMSTTNTFITCESAVAPSASYATPSDIQSTAESTAESAADESSTSRSPTMATRLQNMAKKTAASASNGIVGVSRLQNIAKKTATTASHGIGGVWGKLKATTKRSTSALPQNRWGEMIKRPFSKNQDQQQDEEVVFLEQAAPQQQRQHVEPQQQKQEIPQKQSQVKNHAQSNDSQNQSLLLDAARREIQALKRQLKEERETVRKLREELAIKEDFQQTAEAQVALQAVMGAMQQHKLSQALKEAEAAAKAAAVANPSPVPPATSARSPHNMSRRRLPSSSQRRKAAIRRHPVSRPSADCFTIAEMEFSASSSSSSESGSETDDEEEGGSGSEQEPTAETIEELVDMSGAPLFF